MTSILIDKFNDIRKADEADPMPEPATGQPELPGLPAKAPVTPIKGYQPLSLHVLDDINDNKIAEEELLRVLDAYAGRDDVDKRWLAIGRSHLEQAFMAINRSLARPRRVALE